MSLASKSGPYTVIYDPDAVSDFVTAVKSKEEQRAMLNAVLKLRELGENLQAEATGGRSIDDPAQSTLCWRSTVTRTSPR